METPDEKWVRVTTNARRNATTRLELLQGMAYTPEKFRELHRALVEDYDRIILAAWAEYEPTLTGMYVTPHEVERIRAKRGVG